MVFSLMVLSVSVALHSWARGAMPPVTALLAGAALVWLFAAALAGRERGFPVIAGALAVSQAGLHGLFSVLPASGAHPMVMGGSATPSGWAMVLAHGLAGAFAAGWLYAGEVATWRLVRWLARRVPSLAVLLALVGVVVRIPATPESAWGRLSDQWVPLPAPEWWRSVVRRGPPLALAGTR